MNVNEAFILACLALSKLDKVSALCKTVNFFNEKQYPIPTFVVHEQDGMYKCPAINKCISSLISEGCVSTVGISGRYIVTQKGYDALSENKHKVLTSVAISLNQL